MTHRTSPTITLDDVAVVTSPTSTHLLPVSLNIVPTTGDASPTDNTLHLPNGGKENSTPEHPIGSSKAPSARSNSKAVKRAKLASNDSVTQNDSLEPLKQFAQGLLESFSEVTAKQLESYKKHVEGSERKIVTAVKSLADSTRATNDHLGAIRTHTHSLQSDCKSIMADTQYLAHQGKKKEQDEEYTFEGFTVSEFVAFLEDVLEKEWVIPPPQAAIDAALRRKSGDTLPRLTVKKQLGEVLFAHIKSIRENDGIVLQKAGRICDHFLEYLHKRGGDGHDFADTHPVKYYKTIGFTAYIYNWVVCRCPIPDPMGSCEWHPTPNRQLARASPP